MKRTIILSLLILCSVAVADAETYKWTDDQGVVRSSDDPAQIPSRYRSKALMVEDLPITRKTGVTAPRNVAYTAKNYAKLIGMAGFSEAMLKNHFTLYQGYVTNTNKLLETLEQMLKDGKAANPEFAELKRRLGWEFNGMRLHEYYFETRGGKRESRSWVVGLHGRRLRILAALRPGKRISWQREPCAGSAGSFCIRTMSAAGSLTSGSMSMIRGIRPAACRYWSWMSLNTPSCSITA